MNKFAKLIIDTKGAAFLCILIGLLLGARILTVSLVSTERSPFLLENNMRTCEIKGCNNKHYGKGLCKKHYDKQWQQDNREHYLKQKKQYWQKNKKHFEKYCQDNKEKRIDNYKKWRKNHKKERAEYQNAYYNTEQGKINITRSQVKRKKGLGFNSLNLPKPNYDGHHINNIDVVYIPTKIHQQFQTGDRKEHRKLILEHYGSIENMVCNKPKKYTNT